MLKQAFQRLYSAARHIPIQTQTPPHPEIGTHDKDNLGYCHCCRADSIFEIRGDWLRDNYICANCHSIPRQRHIQHILDKHFPGWDDMEIHESSPSNNFISKYCISYTSSQYFDGVAQGSQHKGVRCENLEDLTFDDESFDIFITQDVLEHLFNPDKAVKEIMRVLKPGGTHIFTAPKNKNLRLSSPRARLENGKAIYLKEKEYHGNPVGDGKSLVTWDYGDDFEVLMSNWCPFPTATYITRDRNLGLDGEYLEVFVTRKLYKGAQ